MVEERPGIRLPAPLLQLAVVISGAAVLGGWAWLWNTTTELRDVRNELTSIQENKAIGDAAGERRAIERAWAAIERRLAMDPDDSAAYDHGAGVLMLLGRMDESRQFSERAIALRPDDGATHYNAACCAAIANDYERSLDLLERAVELGYGNIDWLLNDQDLVPMHGELRFRQLVERLQARKS